MPDLKPQSIRQWLVTIGDAADLNPVYFTKMTAPRITKVANEYNDGQTGVVRKHLGFAQIEDVTLSKPHYPTDKTLIQWATKAMNEGSVFTVTATPVKADEQGTPIEGGVTILLKGCMIMGLTYPEVDRIGDGTAVLELTITVDQIGTQ